MRFSVPNSNPVILPVQHIPDTHYLKQPPIHLANRANSDKPLTVTNQCTETIWPAIITQAGSGPASSGFRLDPGQSNPQTVSADWYGRVWGRTNCTFDANGAITASGQGQRVCGSGDCGPFLECQGAGNPPATLAEFGLSSSSGQAFYDISLVDGYNLPLGIVFLPNGQANLEEIPPNLTNAICIGTASFLTSVAAATDVSLGSNSTYPLPLEQSVDAKDVLQWCPWPLQLNPPQRPGDGVYPYPDANIVRPFFDPCYSACSFYNQDQYCCSGSYANPQKCRPSYYSIMAKQVCPDAYSFAFDDQTSTFVLPEGGGFEIVFCPSGRSTTILKTFGNQIKQIAASGVVAPDIAQLAQNKTYIAEQNSAMRKGARQRPTLAGMAAGLLLLVFALT